MSKRLQNYYLNRWTIPGLERGCLPSYETAGRRNLDVNDLAPGYAEVQARNVKTIARLQSALRRIAVNKTRLSVKGI